MFLLSTEDSVCGSRIDFFIRNICKCGRARRQQGAVRFSSDFIFTLCLQENKGQDKHRGSRQIFFKKGTLLNVFFCIK